MGTRGILTIAVFLLLSAGAAGDGIPFKDERYDGAKTVISLTHDQERIARTSNISTSTTFRLTFGQKVKLLMQSGVSVNEVDIWTVADAHNTCTCELENMAIQFAPGMAEIPHAYLSGEASPCWRIAYLVVVWGVCPLAFVRAGCWWVKRRARVEAVLASQGPVREGQV